MRIEPIKMPTEARFYQPSWVLVLNEGTPREEHYQVWGTGDIRHEGHPTGELRGFWQANWRTHGGSRGGGKKGDTLDRVLLIFPDSIADRFLTVINRP